MGGGGNPQKRKRVESNEQLRLFLPLAPRKNQRCTNHFPSSVTLSKYKPNRQISASYWLVVWIGDFQVRFDFPFAL